MSRLLKISPNLSEICFKHISNKGLRLIAASHCGPSLRIIEAKAGRNSVGSIQSICKACHSLHSLRLWNDYAELNGDTIILAAVQYCPLIEVLPTRWHLTYVAMDALATIHSLKELHLLPSTCTSLSVQAILQSNLTDISLNGEYMDDALVKCIGTYCGSLRSLQLFMGKPILTSIAVQDLFRGCPLLEVVRLHQVGGISSDTLRVMFESCRHLSELDLNLGIIQSDITLEHSLLVGDLILHARYPSLIKLNISRSNMTARALQDIFTYCTSLREVTLINCINVNDETIAVLAQNCCKLETLCLYECKRLSTAGTLQVATEWPANLTTLELTKMPVNDEILLQLSLRCRRLTRLSIAHSGKCKSVTEAGLLILLERCTGLTFLTIRNDMWFTAGPPLDMTNLKLLYPHIQFKSSR